MSAPAILIREARPGEESAIHEAHMRSIREVCIREHGPEEVRGWGNRPLGDRWTEAILAREVLVAETQGRICGHGFMRRAEKEGRPHAYIHSFYLTPEVIGQGIGLRMLCMMLERAKAAGLEEVTLHSTLSAHEFYRNFGFVDQGPLQTQEVGGSLVRCFPMALDLRRWPGP